MKVRYFTADFAGKDRTVIASYLGVNSAARSTTGECSWGKQNRLEDFWFE